MFKELLNAICDEKQTIGNFKKLLKKSLPCDFSKKDRKHGGSLIHWAALYNNKNILIAIDEFLDSKFSAQKRKLFSQKDRSGRTALHWCAYEGSQDSCQFFLDNYSEMVMIQDNSGQTVLHLAAKYRQYSLALQLIEYDENNQCDDEDSWLVQTSNNKGLKAINIVDDVDIKIRLSTSMLRGHVLAPFIGHHLTTHRNYLTESPIPANRLQESELYCRSYKHPNVHELGEKAELRYKGSAELKNGMKAHVGSYGNLLQMRGDKVELTKEAPKHHKSDAGLYDAILKYKNQLCAWVERQFSKTQTGMAIDVNHFTNYPCLMIYIKKSTIHKSDKTKTPSKAAFKSWVNFLLSCITGFINYAAYQEGLPIEMERRASFGFITPTISPTGASIRISMGIVPKVYAKLLVDSLVKFDQLLADITNDDLEIEQLPNKIFYHTAKHKRYLNNKYPRTQLDDALQLLWVQAEKNGQTTAQNITRSVYARDGIARAVFSCCYENGKLEMGTAFNEALLWAINHVDVIDNKLSFKTENELGYSVNPCVETYVCEDKHFWQLIQLIHGRLSALNDETTDACLEKLATCINSKELNDLYYTFNQLHESIFIYAINTKDQEEYGDGFGSDSDEEGEIEGTTVYAKKIITHSGMRAIWCAIIACSEVLGKIRIYLQEAYYEVPMGIKLIRKLHHLDSVTIVERMRDANVILYDINACITNGKNSQKQLTVQKFKAEKKYLILDATSATSEQIHSYLTLLTAERNRAKSILVAESAFKNQQLGGDKNPHGVARVFSKTEKLREILYEKLKKNEKPIRSPTSHRYRHTMKFFGATLSNKAILSAPEPIINSLTK